MYTQSLLNLIQQWPLRKPELMPRVLAGDLKFAADAYAEDASYHGTDGERWQVWLELQTLRGAVLQDEFDKLGNLSWFAVWALERDLDAGVAAYKRLLQRSLEGRARRPFPHHNLLYLKALMRRQRYTDVLEAVAMMQRHWPGSLLSDEELYASRALAALDQFDTAWKRLSTVREHYHDDGNLWGQSALFLQSRDNARALEHLAEAVKLGASDDVLRDLKETFKISSSQWEEMRAPYKLSRDSDQDIRDWNANPGVFAIPCAERSPHVYGGSHFEMPLCAGCKHSIRQWFLFDTTQIPAIKKLLPSWPLLPLLGCTDCVCYMGRHDYEIDFGKRIIRLACSAHACPEYGESHYTAPEIPRQFVRLEQRKNPTDNKEIQCGDWYRPQIGGLPAWTQGPLRVFCRTCRGEMAFVASMTSTKGFEPYIPINNESGMQYHFACDKCKTLSVIAQWT